MRKTQEYNYDSYSNGNHSKKTTTLVITEIIGIIFVAFVILIFIFFLKSLFREWFREFNDDALTRMRDMLNHQEDGRDNEAGG
jgi:uncharacterized membrane protein YqhA